MKVRDFFTFFFCFLALLAVINSAVPIADIYSRAHDGDRAALADLPAVDRAAAKLRHASLRPPFALASFGNSRVLMLNTATLKKLPGDFFNFGIGGQSFRQSNRMLQLLVSMDKLPETVLISFDYPELGLPGGEPVSPGFIERIRDRVDDMGHLQAAGVSTKALAVFVWNNLVAELRRFRLGFTYTVVTARARLIAATFVSMPALPNYFGVDGSVIEQPAAGSKNINWPKKFRRAERYALLEHDLDILAGLAARGSRIIVYESPIAPEIRDSAEANLSVNARDVRRRFFQRCRERNLECYPSPILDGRFRGIHWRDATHAPAQLLADWLLGVIGSGVPAASSANSKTSNDL